MNKVIYIVVGANGFLGKNLAIYFKKMKIAVYEISFRPNVNNNFYSTIEKLVNENDFCCVINCSASQIGTDSFESLDELIDSNVKMPVKLAKLLLTYKNKTELINFGTSWQFNEHNETSPFNAYAASKASVEPFFSHFSLSGLKVASLYLYDTYGKNDSRRKIVNLLFDALANKKSLDISNGMQAIDLIHIDDVVRAVESVINELQNNPDGIYIKYSIRSGITTNIIEVLKLLSEITGIDAAEYINVGKLPYRDRERFKLTNCYVKPKNWDPEISLVEGLSNIWCDKMRSI